MLLQETWLAFMLGGTARWAYLVPPPPGVGLGCGFVLDSTIVTAPGFISTTLLDIFIFPSGSSSLSG